MAVGCRAFWPDVLIVLGVYFPLTILGLLWWLCGDFVRPVLPIPFGLTLIVGRGRCGVDLASGERLGDINARI